MHMPERSILFVTVSLLLAGAALSTPTARAALFNHGAAKEAHVAQDRVDDAASIVNQMKEDPHLARVMDKSYGMFIVPHYGSGAFVVGGQGGGGVVIAKHHGAWSDPAFYNISGGSVGLQAGGTGGAVAMIIMTPQALQRFESGSRWSLSGNAGLTVAKWSDQASVNGRRNDVILWSSANGLYGGLSAGVTRIAPDSKLDDAFYPRHMETGEILTGHATNAAADPLRNALATHVATR